MKDSVVESCVCPVWADPQRYFKFGNGSFLLWVLLWMGITVGLPVVDGHSKMPGAQARAKETESAGGVSPPNTV